MSEHKVSARLPKVGSDELYGAWVSTADGDSCVHVYVAPHGAVIGFNKSHTDDREASDLAVVIQDGEICFQHYDEKGEVHHDSVPAECFYECVLAFLSKLEDLHHHSDEVE